MELAVVKMRLQVGAEQTYFGMDPACSKGSAQVQCAVSKHRLGQIGFGAQVSWLAAEGLEGSRLRVDR